MFAALRHSEGNRGATIVEVAIAIPLFMTMFLGLIDLGRIAYQAVSIQFAISRAGRSAVVVAGGNVATIKDNVVNACRPAGIVLNPTSEVFVCRLLDVPTNGANKGRCFGSVTQSAGGSEEWVIVSVERNLRMFMGHYNVNIRATAMVKNEPY